jgi:hypothetical protein
MMRCCGMHREARLLQIFHCEHLIGLVTNQLPPPANHGTAETRFFPFSACDILSSGVRVVTFHYQG